MLIKEMLAKFQTIYENSQIWSNIGKNVHVSISYRPTVVIYGAINSGRLMRTIPLQTFSSVSKFSEISNALEYRYQILHVGGIGQLSSRGYVVFDSISFSSCYFALQYGEIGYEKHPRFEFHASSYTRKQVPYLSNMTNMFTYATVRVSSIRVTWEMEITFNKNVSSCLIPTVPWTIISEPKLVTLYISQKNIREPHRIYYNVALGYAIGVEIIRGLNISCYKWMLRAYSHSNDCSKYSLLGTLCDIYSQIKYEFILPFRFAVFECYLLYNIRHPIGNIKLRLYSTKCRIIDICSVEARTKNKAYVGYF